MSKSRKSSQSRISAKRYKVQGWVTRVRVHPPTKITGRMHTDPCQPTLYIHKRGTLYFLISPPQIIIGDIMLLNEENLETLIIRNNSGLIILQSNVR